ncbi:MAG: hypothetical protein OHK0015_07430 [Chloroflexi bacterium OHK40]
MDAAIGVEGPNNTVMAACEKLPPRIAEDHGGFTPCIGSLYRTCVADDPWAKSATHQIVPANRSHREGAEVLVRI